MRYLIRLPSCRLAFYEVNSIRWTSSLMPLPLHTQTHSHPHTAIHTSTARQMGIAVGIARSISAPQPKNNNNNNIKPEELRPLKVFIPSSSTHQRHGVVRFVQNSHFHISLRRKWHFLRFFYFSYLLQVY